MKKFFYSRDGASKGAALMIVLAFVVLSTGLALAYFSRTTTDRQLTQSSYNDTSSDLLARSALDIVVGDFKQEIVAAATPVTWTNIQPQRSGDASIPNLIRRSVRNDPIPTPGVPSLASAISSGPVDPANPQRGEITSARWNRHYLIPRLNPANTAIDSTPVSSFVAPDWVLVTGQGPAQAPAPSAVIGRYAFAVYDEGGVLDMNLAGYPTWTGAITSIPSPTPWLVNVGRKGILAFADLTALPTATPTPPTWIDEIVAWRNYAMTQQPATASFLSPNFADDTSGTRQNWYGSYLLNFGDPPFIIDSLSDKLLASTYPFTSASNYMYPAPASGVNSRTDQGFMTRQELLRLRQALCTDPVTGSYDDSKFSQNLLQYMGTFSRERNRPAPDWPGLAGRISEGRFNLSNLALVIPNPADCHIAHGRKTGWQTGKNKNKLCGDEEDVHKLFGLFWVKSDIIPPKDFSQPGYWRYIGNRNPLPGPSVTPAPTPIGCLIGPNQQNDFFQILDYALFQAACGTDDQQLDKTFAIGASLIDQYDSGDQCGTRNKSADFFPGCDLDYRVLDRFNQNRTHTTVILYGHNGAGSASTAYGMEPDYSSGDHTNGDDPWQGNCSAVQSGNNPHRPCGAPAPPPNTQVISHDFATVGEFGYGIVTSAGGPTPGPTPLPSLKFWDNSTSPPFQYAPVLDFFCYNPISSVYPRAGIVNLYTRNAPVLAAILSRTLEKDPGPTPGPSPTPVVSAADAMTAANAIVAETQRVLAGNPTYGSVQHTDLTRAIAGRLAKAAIDRVPNLATSDDTKGTVARALAEVGQTRTWNLLIDVIAQTGRYAPDATDVTQSNKFVVEGEKRYWLHIALGRDLIQADGTPCVPGVSSGCQVDVLGTQLEEVIE